MPIKTEDGWASRGQVKRQFAAWKKARTMLKEKLGDSWHDDTQLNERAEEIFRRLPRDSTGSHKGTSSAAGIDSHGLKKAMFAAGVKLSDKEAVRMIKESDENEDGLLQLSEFQAVIRNEVETYRRRESSVCAVL